ncbi:MAG: AAA family ATPase [Balneolales bacterium]
MGAFSQYPDWAKRLAKKYLGKTLNQFILHGNIRDKVMLGSAIKPDFISLKGFLSDELFASRDIVLFYDRSTGVQFRDKHSLDDFRRSVSGGPISRGPLELPTDPGRVFPLLEQYFRMRISQNKSIACVIDFAETIVPIGETGTAGTEDRNALVFLQKWSHDPLLLSADFTLILLSQNLSDLNRHLIQSPYNAAINIGLPQERERSAYIKSFCDKDEFQQISSVPQKTLSRQTAGLNLVNIQGLLSGARENKKKLTPNSLIENKKELIEAEAYDLLEFVDTGRKLDDVAGHYQVKEHLRQTTEALRNNRPDVLPMGYLVCGPVGTGKTYLVTCFAGEVGIPMVRLKNFRSQWQGVTEGNLEKILSLIEAMAPVAVMIDEADAYLGNRESRGDSGVSSRVFSQIAQFMSNTDNRGKIIWFLMTARPDLMPIDLKRQGRAEEHLALFPPSTQGEREELFRVMAGKTGIRLEDDSLPDTISQGTKMFSGADMEAALTRAMFKASAIGKRSVSIKILEEAFLDFIPPSYPDEIELQTLAAVIECTSQALLPARYRDMDRAEMAIRLEELKVL